MAAGTCPHCNYSVSSLRAHGVKVKVDGRDRWQGVTLACSGCNKVLGAAIDPVALANDIIATIKKS